MLYESALYICGDVLMMIQRQLSRRDGDGMGQFGRGEGEIEMGKRLVGGWVREGTLWGSD